jgi:hypothetical protein
MKTLISLLFAVSAFAQSTVLYSWTFPALGAHDTAITVNVTYDNAVSLSNFMFSQLAQGVAPTTITSNVSSSATSIPVDNITGLAVGQGICFSPSSTTCSIVASTTGTGPYTFVLTTGEIAQITAITPGTAPAGTLTVVRQTVGTAAAYTSGQAATFTAYGNNTEFALSFITNGWAQVIANPAYASKSALAAQAAIAAAQATLNAAAQTH